MHRVEELMKAIWREFSEQTPAPIFERMGYHDAMSKHGSDKPDLRIPGLVSSDFSFSTAKANWIRYIALITLFPKTSPACSLPSRIL